MSDEFSFLEADVSAQVGLPRKDMRQHRNSLVEGEHFTFEKNCAMWSAAGVAALQARLHIPPSPELLSAKNAPEQAPASLVTLLVWNSNLRNRRILEAYLPGTNPEKRENILRVRVRTTENFRRHGPDGQPMRLQVKHIQADLYELCGPCPRRPGKW